jgi:hypothetical protein
MKNKLLGKINNTIEKEAFKYGTMGTESVSVEIELTDYEKEEFYKLELSKNYWWEFEKNILYISYTEDVKDK